MYKVKNAPDDDLGLELAPLSKKSEVMVCPGCENLFQHANVHPGRQSQGRPLSQLNGLRN